MKHKFHALTVLGLILLLILPLSATAQSQTVHLAFLMDGSGSISDADFATMKNGIADALTNSECVPQDGTLELTVIQFSSFAQVELPVTVIDAATVAAAAQAIRNIAQMNESTNYDAGFALAEASINNATDRQLINITTDGAPNEGELDPTLLRERAVAAGFDEIDAEAIVGFEVATNVPAADATLPNSPAALEVLESLVYPQPATVHPPDPWPPTAGGWVRRVADSDAFASTVCEKFQVVVTPKPPTPKPPTPNEIPEPTTLLMLGTGVAALGAYLNRKRGK